MTHGSTAHNGVIYNNNPLIFEEFDNRVEFHFEVAFAELGRRANESAMNIAILNKCHLKRNHTGLGVAQGRGDGGVRHWDDNVSFNREFAEHFTAKLLSDQINPLAKQQAIGSGEVNHFENVQFLPAFD